MMTDEYRTILRICQDYPGCIFRNEDDYRRGAQRFSDPYLAIKTPGLFTVHEILRNGKVGQPLAAYAFEEARHVAR